MTRPNVTIADLAIFSEAGKGLPYLERADALVSEYGPERAYLEESDCHDQWARISFGDGRYSLDANLFGNARRT